jgi:hypothetical protein
VNPRILVLAALLSSPGLAQEAESVSMPAPVENASPPAARFDLHDEAIRKVVRDTAATQYANVRETERSPPESTPAEFVYVPPEPRPQVQETKINLPEPTPASDGFLSQVISIVLDETLGIEDDDGITASNDMLRCRVQKDTRSSPPGVDNCPVAD